MVGLRSNSRPGGHVICIANLATLGALPSASGTATRGLASAMYDSSRRSTNMSFQRQIGDYRYEHCWIEGCPLPATLCQIDHADNWGSGGRTDLHLLGPACQFHNRHRYRFPERYERRRVGKDRWAFTYLGMFGSFRNRRAQATDTAEPAA
jgi:hypothetical protein